MRRVCLNQRGFTLIELLIVVAIIGVLAAIAVPNFMNAMNRAKISRAQNDLKILASALEMYRIDHGNFPYVQDQGGVEWQMPVGFPSNHDRGPAGLTTPVAYLNGPLYDPFLRSDLDMDNAGNPLLGNERCGFGYDMMGQFAPIKPVRVPVDAHGTLEGTAPDYNEADPRLVPREYVVYSVGPDMNHRVLNPDGSVLVRSRFSKLNRYDPSNGLYSQGNIVRFPGGQTFP
ncbi:MAG: type IV pilin protein [bacterium]